jgi:hypothetical protein
MLLKNRITLAFNKFYSNFIKDLKTTNEDIRKVIKRNYKVFDKLSEEYFDYYKGQVDDVLPNLVNDDASALSGNESVLGKQLVKDVTVKAVIATIDNDVDRNVLWNYVYILTLLVLVRKEFDEIDTENEDDLKAVDMLFTSVISILAKVQQQQDVSDLLEQILDDDVKKLLSKVKSFKEDVKLEEEPSSTDMPFPPFGNMQDSMICNLAKEISNEIDVSNIHVEKPEDVLKLMDFSASNNLVGDIIKKVSTKIHDKISSGELKQEELFGEAMSMMSMLNMGGSGGAGGGLGGLGDLGGLFNNPMMGEMMKAMKKGKAVPKQDAFKKSNARDRLRAKLDERRKQNGA